MDVAPLDADDLRGLHFAATGGVLLHVSSFACDRTMPGRHDSVVDTYGRIRHCLERLRWSLSVLGHHPNRVMTSDDLASLALAAALGRLLGVPVTRIDGGPGLIAVYDTARLSDAALDNVSFREPGQLLYAHASCRSGRCIAPDLTGLLYRSIVAPWDDASTLPGSESPGSGRNRLTGNAGALADNIVHASASEPIMASRDTDDELFRFCRAARSCFRGEPGPRPMMPGGGGPVRCGWSR